MPNPLAISTPTPPQVVGLIAVSACLLAYWAAVLYQVARTARLIPTARRGLALSEAERGEGVSRTPPLPQVCVIVPAHNEEASIGLIAASLLRQDYPALRVVFSLDRCTDRTLPILRETIGDDPRFEIVEVSACPEDWAGKVHALWTAVRTAEGVRGAELLLFADADTVFDPACVRATVALMKERGLDMLSLLSTLTNDAWFERVVQPAAAMELVRQYPLVRANRRAGEGRRRAFANGQYILIERGAYDRIGGHEAVKAELVEDIHLARLAERHGLRAGVFLADGLLACRMYRSWDAFKKGWARIYGEAANRRAKRLRRAAWRLRGVGAVLPGVGALCVVAGVLVWRGGDVGLGVAATVVGGAGLAVYAGALTAIHVMGRSRLSSVAAYPVGAWLTGSILLQAARDLEKGRPTEWGGRAYRREKR